MIPRYSRPEMVAIWSPETKFKIWYEIEAHACEAMANIGVIPRENADAVWKAKDVEFLEVYILKMFKIEKVQTGLKKELYPWV